MEGTDVVSISVLLEILLELIHQFYNLELLRVQLFRNVLNQQRNATQTVIENLTRNLGALNGYPIPRVAINLFPEKKRKCIWMKTRSNDWWERIVNQNFDDGDWLENFRMRKISFNRLCGIVSDGMSPSEVWVREPIPLRKRVAIAVFKLASCCENRVVANAFGVSKSSVVNIVRKFVLLVSKQILGQFISFPNDDEAQKIAENFERKFKFPQAYAAIDGTHIPILPPEDGLRDFINRKQWASFVLQAVVDDKFCFRNISCKVPGSAHDAQVLKESEIYKTSHRLPKAPMNINGVDVPLVILGDPAYPLLPWLMKGYTGAAIKASPENESFNVHLSSVRMAVEIAFGRLKARWRMVLKRMDVHYTLAPHVIATCCALHNFVEEQKEDLNPNWLATVQHVESEQFPQPRQRIQEAIEGDASTFREVIKMYLAENFPLKKSMM